MNYLLDTNVVSYLADQRSPHNALVSARFAATQPDDQLSVSILTFYEAAFAAQRLSLLTEISRLIESVFLVLPLPMAGAGRFATLKADLAARRGLPPKRLTQHNIDLMIAATAIALDLTLVSNDSIFPELAAIDPRLNVEDWTT